MATATLAHVETNDKVTDNLAKEIQAEDVVMCMGAGSISAMAYATAEKLGGKI